MEWTVVEDVSVFTMKECVALDVEFYLFFSFALCGDTFYSWGKVLPLSTENDAYCTTDPVWIL